MTFVRITFELTVIVAIAVFLSSLFPKTSQWQYLTYFGVLFSGYLGYLLTMKKFSEGHSRVFKALSSMGNDYSVSWMLEGDFKSVSIVIWMHIYLLFISAFGLFEVLPKIN